MKYWINIVVGSSRWSVAVWWLNRTEAIGTRSAAPRCSRWHGMPMSSPAKREGRGLRPRTT